MYQGEGSPDKDHISVIELQARRAGTYSQAGFPVSRVAQVIERADDFEQRVRRTLADALIEVLEQLDELERGRLDVGEEVTLGRGEDGTDSVRGDLLLDVDTRAEVQERLEIALAVVALVVGDVDGARWGETRRRSETGSDLGVGHCAKH